MGKRILGWLDVHEKELQLLLWTTALLFLVRSSGMILNNYAETAFLKRFGVEFMPLVNMLNAIATVVVMGIMAGLMQRIANPKLLEAQFFICGLSVIALWLLIPYGVDLIYPLLFMLKSQYEVLLAMLFWNMANDLFNTRQSKRLFPLITAGGVIGLIVSSFATPWLSRWLRFDNLLVVHLFICIAGALVVRLMSRRFPILWMMEEDRDPTAKKAKTSMIKEFTTIWPMLKSSVLLRIMVLLTFMPNVLIPIMNYQFNYAVDNQFASESGMVMFFGYFRGVLNIVSLFILLFVGKIYGRWGLPVALMFHPFNYVLAFAAFLFRFDIVSAMYARMSTNIIRTTINMPANAVMMGLFPESFRASVRPFLRGTVVRVALFLGSGLILASDYLFHPRYLSLVALPFLLAWLIGPFILKRRYADILLDLIVSNQLNLQELDQKEVAQLFRDRKIQKQLVMAFLDAKPQDVLWYASLLERLKVPNIDTIMLKRLESLPLQEKLALIDRLPDDAGVQTTLKLQTLAVGGNDEITLACLSKANRMTPEVSRVFDRRSFLIHKNPQIRAYAAAGLMALGNSAMAHKITAWLTADDPQTQKAGIIAAGLTGDERFAATLKEKLTRPQDDALRAETIRAVHEVGVHDSNPVMLGFFSHTNQAVRQEALKAYHVIDKESLKQVIALLADPDPDIARIAEDRIASAVFQDGKTLIKALNTPNKATREHLFNLLERLQIRDVDLFRYALRQLEGAYRYLAERDGVRMLPKTAERDLFAVYLKQQSEALVDNVLRVLAIQDRSGNVRTIVRGLHSTNSRQRANGVEALEDLVDKSLVRLLSPLLGDATDEQIHAMGRRRFKIPDYRKDLTGLIAHLLDRWDRLTVLFTLQLLTTTDPLPADPETIAPLTSHADQQIMMLARRLMAQTHPMRNGEEKQMETPFSLPEIILRLKTIDIFEQLSVEALAAVASVTETATYEQGQVVIQEGEPGETLFLVIDGDVVVIKSQEDGREIELDRIGTGDYFGEMALFEDIPRTATIRTATTCRMLMLHKQEFKEMVREYPQIALEICKALSGRIRKLHEKISQETVDCSVQTRD